MRYNGFHIDGFYTTKPVLASARSIGRRIHGGTSTAETDAMLSLSHSASFSYFFRH
jgi:hypothetical protein